MALEVSSCFTDGRHAFPVDESSMASLDARRALDRELCIFTATRIATHDCLPCPSTIFISTTGIGCCSCSIGSE